MNFVIEANKHECAHIPAATPEQERQLSKALDKIFNRNSNKDNQEMTTAGSAKEQLDQVVEQSADVAQELLKVDGWAILRQMYTLTAQSIDSTKVVVLPTLQNLNYILGKVSDPEAFNKQLDAIQTDLSNIISALGLLVSKHKDRSGEPNLDDMILINELSLGYTQLQTTMETAIQPLLLAMIDVMQEAGVDTLNWGKE